MRLLPVVVVSVENFVRITSHDYVRTYGFTGSLGLRSSKFSLLLLLVVVFYSSAFFFYLPLLSRHVSDEYQETNNCCYYNVYFPYLRRHLGFHQKLRRSKLLFS